MAIFFNELSLHNQFHGVSDFLPALQTMNACKNLVEKFGLRLTCKREIINYHVFDDMPFTRAINLTRQRNIIRLIMSWLSKHGPFLDDSQQHSSDDYLYLKYNDDIVTKYSLGEAAYQIAVGHQASTVSISPSNFERNPIHVVWDKTDDEIIIPVSNFWEVEELAAYLKLQQAPIQSWIELLQRAKVDFPKLVFFESVSTILEGESFNSAIADRIMFQLNILNKLATCFDGHGERTTDGHNLIKNHFQGDRAIFSDESKSNKIKFERDMTFNKPDGGLLFCPFHGKIRHRSFRLHFSWPIQHNKPVYIAYIGPKITK